MLKDHHEIMAKNAQIVLSYPTFIPYNSHTNSLRPKSIISAKHGH